MSEQLAIGSQTRWCTHDVLPAADNDILLPVLDVKEPFFVLVPEVAGFQPSIFRQGLWGTGTVTPPAVASRNKGRLTLAVASIKGQGVSATNEPRGTQIIYLALPSTPS